MATRKLHVKEIKQINWNKGGAPDEGGWYMRQIHEELHGVDIKL